MILREGGSSENLLRKYVSLCEKFKKLYLHHFNNFHKGSIFILKPHWINDDVGCLSTRDNVLGGEHSRNCPSIRATLVRPGNYATACSLESGAIRPVTSSLTGRATVQSGAPVETQAAGHLEHLRIRTIHGQTSPTFRC